MTLAIRMVAKSIDEVSPKFRGLNFNRKIRYPNGDTVYRDRTGLWQYHSDHIYGYYIPMSGPEMATRDKAVMRKYVRSRAAIAKATGQ